MNFLSAATTTVCVNQLPYLARFNPNDPGELDLKFDIFYNGVIEACDQVLVAPGYTRSTGCQKEIAHAQHIGRPLYLIDYPFQVPSLEQIEALENLQVLTLGVWGKTWTGVKPSLAPWENYVIPLD